MGGGGEGVLSLGPTALGDRDRVEARSVSDEGPRKTGDRGMGASCESLKLEALVTCGFPSASPPALIHSSFELVKLRIVVINSCRY